MEEEKYRPVIGITVGDLNGIGLEVIIKTFMDSRMLNYCIPVIYGAVGTINYHKKTIEEAKAFIFNAVHNIEQIHPKRVNVVTCWEENVRITFGMPNPENAKFAFTSLDVAMRDALNGKLDAIVTAPIDKKAIQQADFNFPGHTEYFGSKYDVKPLMFMVSDELKVATATGHIPVSEISKNLTQEVLIQKIKLMIKSLKEDFLIPMPTIGVLGLNPHAGENGLLGTEEQEIITPAIDKFKERDYKVFGPFPADGYFANNMQNEFDATIAMYHDQGLIPFKQKHFADGVNFTAGLPIVRTSPDHGTGYTLAGKDMADASSFRAAVFKAIEILRNRRSFAEMNENPLQKQFTVDKEK